MTADSAGPSGPRGALRGAAPFTPGALPSTGTAPSAPPTAPDPTASRTADPDATTGAPAPGPVDSGAPRPVPTPSLVGPAPAGSPGMPSSVPADRCGAPENPYGYTYCGGVLVHDPAPDICRWFTCVDGFWQGRGYLTVCEDGRLGMVGGRTGSCPERAGRKEPVYVYQPAAG